MTKPLRHYQTKKGLKPYPMWLQPASVISECFHTCQWRGDKSFVAAVQSLSRVCLVMTPWTATHRLPCPSASPEFAQVCAHWSVTPSSHLTHCHPFPVFSPSFPAWGSFPMIHLFPSGGQSTGASASPSVFPKSILDWFPLRLTSFSLCSQGTLKSLLQHHSWKASILWHSAFFIV